MFQSHQIRRRFASAVLLETTKTGNLAPVNNNVIAAAKKIENDIFGVLLDNRARQEAVKMHGLSKVIVVNNKEVDFRLSGNSASAIEKLQAKYNFAHWLAPHSPFGKDILPRASGLLGIPCITDIVEIVGEPSSGLFKRPIYAGNAIATIKCAESPKMLTIRGTAFEPITSGVGNITLEDVVVTGDEKANSEWIGFAESGGTGRPELSSARVVVSGGRAFKSHEQFEQVLGALADSIPGASIGASRAAVDSGLAPNDWQIGQTGKIVAPALYIAIGISGAIQHVAGMKDSRVIVAINKDGDAPIFQIADFGLVGDINQIIPELTAKLQKL